MNTASLLTTSEVAARLNVARQTVVNMVNRGEIHPVTRVSATNHGAYLFAPEEVSAVAQKRAKAVAK
ncbi:helix-turn-helix domain-containing protein [Brevibacterium sp. UMB10442]|nr:helix-turn-helix domain-containing protein [Brevibacterium sp. UMB10442]